MKKIRIGDVDFQVIEEPNLFVERTDIVDGSINYTQGIIRVVDNVSLDYKNQVLCHEIIHGIIEAYNVPINKEDNEKITEAMCKGLHQVLKDNPDLLFKRSNK